jgi:hypothetical protein
MKSLQDIKALLAKGVHALQNGGYSISQPVPCIEGSYRTERVFFYPSTLKIERVRPYAWASVSSEHGRVLSFQYCAINDFMDTQKHPLDQIVDYSVPSAKTAKEQGELLKQYDTAYDAVRTFAFADKLDETQRNQLKSFQQLMSRTIPAGLMPYYESLSPDFFKWMKQQTA